MLQQTLAVFLVLSLLLAALWFLQRHGIATFNVLAGSKLLPKKTRVGRHMRVLERVILTPQHALHLVSIDNRLVVFATSPSGCHAMAPAVAKPHSGPNADQGEEVSFGTAASC